MRQFFFSWGSHDLQNVEPRKKIMRKPVSTFVNNKLADQLAQSDPFSGYSLSRPVFKLLISREAQPGLRLTSFEAQGQIF